MFIPEYYFSYLYVNYITKYVAIIINSEDVISSYNFCYKHDIVKLAVFVRLLQFLLFSFISVCRNYSFKKVPTEIINKMFKTILQFRNCAFIQKLCVVCDKLPLFYNILQNILISLHELLSQSMIFTSSGKSWIDIVKSCPATSLMLQAIPTYTEI